MASKPAFKRTDNEVKTILKECNLERYYNYLFRNGFTSIQTLKLLHISDFQRLPEIPYGHLKLIIETTQQFIQTNSIIITKYKQYLMLLDKLPDPTKLFTNIDQMVIQYQHIKEQYIAQYSKYDEYHFKISNALQTSTCSENGLLSIIEDVQPFLIKMQNLTDSLNRLQPITTTSDYQEEIHQPLTTSNIKSKHHKHDNAAFIRRPPTNTDDIKLNKTLTTFANQKEESYISSTAVSSFKYEKIAYYNDDDDDDNDDNKSTLTKSRVFEGSTHYYLIYVEDPENNNKRSIGLWILGLCCLVIQIILNFVIIEEGYDALIKDQVPVLINWHECGHDDEQILRPDHFRCIIRENNPAFLALAMVLVSVFLQYDYFATIKVILCEKRIWCKFAAFLILLESMATTWACCLYAYQGWFNSEGYDIVMNTVGILFIHDLDEKLFEAVSVLTPKEMKIYNDPNNFGFCQKYSKYCICRKIGLFLKNNTKMLVTMLFTMYMICIGRWILFQHFEAIDTEGQ